MDDRLTPETQRTLADPESASEQELVLAVQEVSQVLKQDQSDADALERHLNEIQARLASVRAQATDLKQSLRAVAAEMARRIPPQPPQPL